MFMKKLRKSTRELDDRLCDAITLVNLIHKLFNGNQKRSLEEIQRAADAGDPVSQLYAIVCSLTDVLEDISEAVKALSGKPIIPIEGAPSKEVSV